MKVNKVLNIRRKAMKAHRSVAEQKLEEIQKRIEMIVNILATEDDKTQHEAYVFTIAIDILDIINTQA